MEELASKHQANGRVVYLTEADSGQGRGMWESEPDCMGRQHAASLLGVNPKTIDREIRAGRLRCFHVGRSVRITKQALIDYVKENES